MNTRYQEYLYADEADCVNECLDYLDINTAQRGNIRDKAIQMVEQVRATKDNSGRLQAFIQEFDLTSEEGLALMTLAESLLRVPDKLTADILIRDKLNAAEWDNYISTADDVLVRVSSLGLSISKKVLNSMVDRLGMPVIRQATYQAMRVLGGQFVLGRDIQEALKLGSKFEEKGYLYSYDMLGEGARTTKDADRYFEAYKDAILEIGKKRSLKNGEFSVLNRPGISIKLSALNPVYHYAHREVCIPDLTDKLLELAVLAAQNNIGLTMDAEEVARLDMSLEIFDKVATSSEIKDWSGLGLAVQAYAKRALPLVRHMIDQAKTNKRDLNIRLVKGAYWDTEIKHCQVMGYPDYPLFTRKVNTDMSYLACAKALLEARGTVTPFIGSHNAHTLATVMEMAGKDISGFAFQRLHGMAEQLHAQVLDLGIPVSIYGPVGPHRDLLPYLVRRLLENGANSSFINQIYDNDFDPVEVIGRPIQDATEHPTKRHMKIALPRDIYLPDRPNSHGLDLDAAEYVDALYKHMELGIRDFPIHAESLVFKALKTQGTRRDVFNPANPNERVGGVTDILKESIEDVFEHADKGFEIWSNFHGCDRAKILEKIAHLLEKNQSRLMALCIKEAGKTIPDCVAEIREAIEFCYYYAARGRKHFGDGIELTSPTGEQNIYRLKGRGTFVCISPWNFPLAIFTGQIAAALMAGNAVIAKPAEQTSLIAYETVKLMHEAGVPKDTLQLVLGDGEIGASLIAHKDVAGVAFTGSTNVAKAINLSLAQKDGPIVPLIAETGGLNAMIVDSSALPEQVVDDALLSGFGSAGQRCSALRILCIQDDIADGVIEMLIGAAQHQSIGDPWKLSSDIGPVIDEDALKGLHAHVKRLKAEAKILFEAENIPKEGTFFAPVLAEIDRLDFMKEEVFGPIIHVYRFKAKEKQKLYDDLNGLGYGLTCGVHSRINTFTNDMPDNIRVGNMYINRGMTGAVVGVQPFGGRGLSGTGPKAGGPNYLQRFATEQVVSIDTTRAGGNTHLVSLEED